jgi:molybdopterin-synthase adenylyltransferase
MTFPDSRYSRQELFPGIGKEGQQMLRSSSAAIVGCGALGSLQAETLVRAGIGRLKIIDRDFVEPSNLQRQSLFTESDAMESLPKAVAAATRLKQINHEVEVIPMVADLSADDQGLLDDIDIILDGTDNFQTRYLLNDLSWKNSIPWIYGACVASSGLSCAFVPDSFPCLRCLFETEPPVGTGQTCDTAGIIWPAVGAIVSFQIASAMKILTRKNVHPELLQLDVWTNHYHVVSLNSAKRADCLTCGTKVYPSLQKSAELHTTICGRDAVQIKPKGQPQLNLDSIYQRWQKVGSTTRNAFLVKLILSGNELILFPDGRALIKGTTDFTRARDLYSKYVGV